MNAVWTAFLSGFTLLSTRGRQILVAYCLGLILLAGLDGAALYFVSRAFSASAGGDSIVISSGGSMLTIVIVLFTPNRFINFDFVDFG
jgi:hypothetical protein